MTAFTLEDHERQSMVRDDGIDYIIDKPLPDFFELKKQLEEIFEKKKARVTANQNKKAEERVAKTTDTSADQVKVANGDPVQAADSDSEKTANTSAKSSNE
jgi:hypothetical protein